MNLVKLKPLVLVALLSLVPTSNALAYCSEPNTPSCASRYGEFDDEWEFDRCKREMESYKDDVEGGNVRFSMQALNLPFAPMCR